MHINANTVRQNPWNVFYQSTACNMSNSLNVNSSIQQCKHVIRIINMRFQQGEPHRFFQFRDGVIHIISADLKKELSGEGIAVGMQSARWQPQYNIFRLNRFTCNDLVFFHHTGDDTHKIMFARQVSVRHFCSFATNKGDSRIITSGDHTRNDFFYNFRLQFVVGDIIEKG